MLAVIIVNSVVGNIFNNRSLATKYRRKSAEGKCESLNLSRAEMDHLRLKRTTDGGTDVGIVLESDRKLCHGDVLVDSKGKIIVVKQRPERVACVRVREKNPDRIAETAAIIGHVIGNRHRPISVAGGKILFPVMADSEIEVFRKLFPHGSLELKTEEKIFKPNGETAGHEH